MQSEISELRYRVENVLKQKLSKRSSFHGGSGFWSTAPKLVDIFIWQEKSALLDKYFKGSSVAKLQCDHCDILGVLFQTFPAERLSKRLSRMLWTAEHSLHSCLQEVFSLSGYFWSLCSQIWRKYRSCWALAFTATRVQSFINVFSIAASKSKSRYLRYETLRMISSTWKTGSNIL